jgi:hypothetical protein
MIKKLKKLIRSYVSKDELKKRLRNLKKENKFITKMINAQSREIMRLTNRKIVLILSAKRSGSTLLKALLAQANDVSHLPETNYPAFTNIGQYTSLTNKRIILIKRPCWDNEAKKYPIIPKFVETKKIFLIRDVYSVVKSLKKRHEDAGNPLDSKWYDNDVLVNYYWYHIYSNIVNRFNPDEPDVYFIKYEDLVKDPIKETEKLFEFIGSDRKEGTDTYSKPKKYKWRWGIDDASENIKKLKVIEKEVVYDDEELIRVINNSNKVCKLRKRLGYKNQLRHKHK